MPTGSNVTGDGSASVVLRCLGDLVSVPMTVETYMREYRSRLDARSFREIDRDDGDMELNGKHGEERLKREGDWLRSWKHRERRGMETLRTGMTTLRNVGSGTEISFICCRKEQEYESRLTRLVGELIENMVTNYFVAVKSVNFSKVVLDRPFDSLWFIRSHRHGKGTGF